MICPKCQHERTAADDPAIPDYQCPACGVIYAKFGKPPTISARQNTTPNKQPTSVENISETAGKIGDAIRKSIGHMADKYIETVKDKRSEAKTVETTSEKRLPTESEILIANLEASRHKTNHVLHFLITLITLGLWSVVWFIFSASNTSERNKVYKKYGLPLESNKSAGVVIFFMAFFMFILGLKLFVWPDHQNQQVTTSSQEIPNAIKTPTQRLTPETPTVAKQDKDNSERDLERLKIATRQDNAPTENPVCKINIDQLSKDAMSELELKYPSSYSLHRTLLLGHIQAYEELCAIKTNAAEAKVLKKHLDTYYPSMSLIKTLYEGDMKAYQELHKQ